jgi:hypothetical protein
MGYSVYRGSPGFRTLGRNLDWLDNNEAKLFATQDAALEYLRTLTTPRCDVDD